jgi:hypothetical protein
MLQLGNRIRRPHVLFTAGTPGIFTTGIQHVQAQDRCPESGSVVANRFFSHFKQTDTAHLSWGAGKVLLDEIFCSDRWLRKSGHR